MKEIGKTDKNIFLCSVFNCENNGYYGTRIYRFFKINGYKLVKRSSDSDTIIINTCAVTEYAEKKCEKVIDYYLKKYGTEKQIIIYGCFSKINKEYLNTEGVTCIGPYELNYFNKMFEHKVPIQNIKANIINKGFNETHKLDFYTILISQGCVNECSYCSIKKAKGHLRSKKISKIIKEFKEGLLLGYTKFKLVADDCGCYGLDINKNFGVLLDEISNLNEDLKIDIHCLEPSRFIKHFEKIVNFCKKNKIIHINIPLQTGSQRILNLMNRSYDIAKCVKYVRYLRKNFNIHITSDFIVGFPTESREEFEQTIKLFESFDIAEIFLYSPRKGTKAYNLKGELSEEELNYRNNILEELTKKNPKKYHYQNPNNKY